MFKTNCFNNIFYPDQLKSIWKKLSQQVSLYADPTTLCQAQGHQKWYNCKKSLVPVSMAGVKILVLYADPMTVCQVQGHRKWYKM